MSESKSSVQFIRFGKKYFNVSNVKTIELCKSFGNMQLWIRYFGEDGTTILDKPDDMTEIEFEHNISAQLGHMNQQAPPSYVNTK